MEFCIRLLKFGYSVAYQAEACIYHSHQYDLFQLSGRYFDIGVFFNQSKQLLRGLSPHPEGKHYLIETLTVLNNRKKKSWIPRFVIETSIKYISFWLGTREEMLPVWVKRRLSGQGYYWQ
jgi:rhamnosyltransferase